MHNNILNVSIIAPFPSVNATHTRLRGVASYTKNLVLALCMGSDNVRVKIFANLQENSRETYKFCEPILARDRGNEGILWRNRCRVVRCWGEGVLYLFQILPSIWHCRREIDIIHIQHEYAQFGRFLSALLFPLLLRLLRLTQKPVIVTLHGVVEKGAVTHSFRSQHFLKVYLPFLGFGFDFVNKWIGRLANCLIVHEEPLKKILIGNYHVAENKVEVIPHGIEIRKDIIERDTARRTLGVENRRMLLFFGYLAGYKGLEILIEAFRFLDKNHYILFVAGGEPHHLRNNSLYIKRITHLKQTAHKISNNIIFTGFVPEKRISLYFSATDLIIFPYTEMHACSGAFCLALSYKCPFLASKVFTDFCGLPPELSFEYNAKLLGCKIAEFFESEDLRMIAVKWIEKFRNKRLWSNVAKRTSEVYRSHIRILLNGHE